MYAYKEIITLDDPQHLTLSRPLPLQKGQQVEVFVIAKEKVDKESQVALLKLLLDSPEMSDTEFQAIQEKRQHLNQWL